jgi:hypothetical protein
MPDTYTIAITSHRISRAADRTFQGLKPTTKRDGEALADAVVGHSPKQAPCHEENRWKLRKPQIKPKCPRTEAFFRKQ